MSASEQFEVVIIGAGPVGLSLAIEMGGRGIRCLVVEQNDRVGYNPRAKTTNVRSREHLRRWGIAENLRQASKLPAGYPSDIIFATRLNGPELARIEDAFNCSPERNDLYSESGQWIPQYVLEEVLRQHAVSFPNVEIRFNTRFVEATQNSDDVQTVVANVQTAENQLVTSRYLIGADGSRSNVRELIGATMNGKRGIAANYNVQFRAPGLAALNPHGPAIMYWIINGDSPSLIGPMEGLDLWYFIATRIEGDIQNIDAKDLIRRATNLDFEMEILGTSPWVAHSLIADKYSHGRIFLAGDACHLHPPFGGYGMNMGIGDGVDLGWKMAAMLQGWAGPGLLESYEQERRQVHQRIIEEAVANYGALGNHLTLPGLETPGSVGDATRREAGDVIFTAKLREFKTLGAVLGYRYADSTVIVPDGTEPPPANAMIYQPSAHPGCLAPHLWLEDGSSLYDHFGEGFTLLGTAGNCSNSFACALEAADQVGVPLKTIAPSDSRLSHRYAARFALIRPDQHVAWRGNELPSDFAEVLRQVTGCSSNAHNVNVAPTQQSEVIA
jgi:2-polyprenyl-6-methoxyphenol hydroxylase-like FAD-dependent oxidoreductase